MTGSESWCKRTRMASTTKWSALVLLLVILRKSTTAFVVTTGGRGRAAVVSSSIEKRVTPSTSRSRRSSEIYHAARGIDTSLFATTGFFESLFSGLKTQKRTNSMEEETRRLSGELFGMLTAEGTKPDDEAVMEKIMELEARPGVSFNRDAMYDGPWRVLWKTNTAWQRYFDPLKGVADNRAYQWYKEDGSVTNIAQALGDKLYVTVDGQGTPASTSMDLPYKINVEVSQGWLNALGSKIPLKFIKGKGSTIVVYIDEKLRVFRSDTGGVVVQTKADEAVPV